MKKKSAGSTARSMAMSRTKQLLPQQPPSMMSNNENDGELKLLQQILHRPTMIIQTAVIITHKSNNCILLKITTYKIRHKHRCRHRHCNIQLQLVMDY